LTITKRTDARAKRTKQWQKKFLAALAKTPSVKHACIAAGISGHACYQHRAKDRSSPLLGWKQSSIQLYGPALRLIIPLLW
jgi:hypothetical protein